MDSILRQQKQELNITPNPTKNNDMVVWDFKVGRFGNKKIVNLDCVFIQQKRNRIDS